MDFEYELRMLLVCARKELNSGAFAIYQPGYITIGNFDVHGHLQVIADTKMMDIELTFNILYEQIRQRINELEPIDITMDF